jgi:hypothetical protein
VKTLVREDEQTGAEPSDAVVALAVQRTASQAEEPNQAPRTSRQTTVAAAAAGNGPQASPWVVHGFAAFYLVVITIAWLFQHRVPNPEYFAQAAFVLTSIGLYHATPPTRKR